MKEYFLTFFIFHFQISISPSLLPAGMGKYKFNLYLIDIYLRMNVDQFRTRCYTSAMMKQRAHKAMGDIMAELIKRLKLKTEEKMRMTELETKQDSVKAT